MYVWQLPQHLVGLAILIFHWIFDKEEIMAVVPEWTGTPPVKIFYIDDYSKKYSLGVSLGYYIFLSKEVMAHTTLTTERHECGHSRQSRMLGWFYLPVVGIPSFVHALFFKKDPKDKNKYYRFWTEKWADRLGGVWRDMTKKK